MAQPQLQHRPAQEQFPLHAQFSPAAAGEMQEDRFHEEQTEAFSEHNHKKSVLEKVKDKAQKLKSKIKDVSGHKHRSSEDDHKDQNDSSGNEEEEGSATAAATDLRKNTADESLYGEVSSGLKAIRLDEEPKHGLHHGIDTGQISASPAALTAVAESRGIAGSKVSEERNPPSFQRDSPVTGSAHALKPETPSHDRPESKGVERGDALNPVDRSSEKPRVESSNENSKGFGAEQAATDQSSWTEKVMAAKDAALLKLGYGSPKGGDQKTLDPESKASNEVVSKILESQPDNMVSAEEIKKTMEDLSQKDDPKNNAGDKERSSNPTESTEKPKSDDQTMAQRLTSSAAEAEDTITSKTGVEKESAKGEVEKKESMMPSTGTSESTSQKLRTTVSQKASKLKEVLSPGKEETDLAERITHLLSPSQWKESVDSIFKGSSKKDASSSSPGEAKGLLSKLPSLGSFFRSHSSRQNEEKPQSEEGGILKEGVSSTSNRLSSEAPGAAIAGVGEDPQPKE